MSIFSLPGLPRANLADSLSRPDFGGGAAHVGGGLIFRIHEAIMRRPTRRIVKNLVECQSLRFDQLQARQSQDLANLVTHARRHCPFFGQSDYAAADSFQSPNDLRTLPFMTRSEIRSHARDMCRRDASPRLLFDHTRGSTDEKLVYFWDRNRQAWDKANRLRGHAWHGFNHANRELHLWPVDPPTNLQGRLRLLARRWRDALLAESQLDTLLLDRLDPAEFWAKIRRFNPTRISAFPSALAAMIQRDPSTAADTEIPALRAVFLTGEATFPWQKRLIEQALRVPCFQSYGVQEAGAIAYECPRRSWHMCSESIFVEFIRENREALPGELAEVVVTGLQSHAMPMIRYRTGDIVRVRRESCACGLSLPAMPHVIGRIFDFLITDDGRWLEPSRTIETLSSIFGNGAFQLEQNSNGAIEISVLENSSLREDWSSRLSAVLQGLFGHRVAFTIQRVPRLLRSEFGKCRYVHSNVPRTI